MEEDKELGGAGEVVVAWWSSNGRLAPQFRHTARGRQKTRQWQGGHCVVVCGEWGVLVWFVSRLLGFLVLCAVRCQKHSSPLVMMEVLPSRQIFHGWSIPRRP